MSGRIEQLEQRVSDAKKAVRDTLSVSELSRESIKDIIGEISKTNEALADIFGASDSELSAGSRYLKGELEKISEEAKSADKKRMKVLAARAKELSAAAAESGDADAELISKSAKNLEEGLKKAGTHAGKEEGATAKQWGAGLFTTMFGDKLGGWMASMDSGGASEGTRQAADIRLRISEANLE